MEIRIKGIGNFKGVDGRIDLGEKFIFSISDTEEDWNRVKEAKAYFDGLEDNTFNQALKTYTAIMIETTEDRFCNSPLAGENNQGWNLKDMVTEVAKIQAKMKKDPDGFERSTKTKVSKFIKTYEPIMDKRCKAKH